MWIQRLSWKVNVVFYFSLLSTMVGNPRLIMLRYRPITVMKSERLIMLWYPPIIVMNGWSFSDTLQSSWWTSNHAPIPPNHRDERLIMLRYSPIIVMNEWSCSDTLQSSWWTTDHAPILSNYCDERLIMLRYSPIIEMNGWSCSDTIKSSWWVESIEAWSAVGYRRCHCTQNSIMVKANMLWLIKWHIFIDMFRFFCFRFLTYMYVYHIIEFVLKSFRIFAWQKLIVKNEKTRKRDMAAPGFHS
jgi:hypothetical protein